MTVPSPPSQEEIKQFWDAQAQRFRESGLATSPDLLNKSLEISAVMRHVQNGEKILNVGCGNGQEVLAIARQFDVEIHGIDFTRGMIDAAQTMLGKISQELSGRARFTVGDARNLPYDDGSFDRVLSCRCIINIPSWLEQQSALKEITRVLRPGGTYVMVENFVEPVEKLNRLRRWVGLGPITTRWHNVFMSQRQVISFMNGAFELEAVESYESTYYVASRVINAWLTPRGKDPSYDSWVNRFGAKLPSIGDFGPTKLLAFRKNS